MMGIKEYETVRTALLVVLRRRQYEARVTKEVDTLYNIKRLSQNGCFLGVFQGRTLI